ncbi:MAG: DUF6240 domain-containing protein, partial [Lachnospiraceae bacterium]|nr:DUF6240 domain-containing protein [Lachnospiraceae bacterium]
MNLKIDEQTLGIRQIQNNQQTGHAAASPLSSFSVSKGAGAGSGLISVDLQTSGFGDQAYAERRRSLRDVTGGADAGDLAAAHDAMVLLSNTLSGEDYERAMKDGYQPGDAGTQETVTIMDRIKTAMLQAGKEVAGFTDDLDRETLEKITGSQTIANALENSFADNDLPMDEELVSEAADAVRQAVSLQAPDDAAVKYLVENHMDPTIRNLTIAESATNGGNVSAGGFYRQEGGYFARKAENIDFDRLAPQIDAVVERAGFTDEEAGEEARWVVANDMPLTEETLTDVVELKRVSFPVDVQLAADAAASAIADGRTAVEGNLSDPVSLNRKAAALMQRQELEEARLFMSSEANLRLLDKGVKIDTLPMEQLIDELKAARKEIAGELFPADADIPAQDGTLAEQKYTLFDETIRQTALIRTAPAAMIAAEKETIAQGTLGAIADKGSKIAAAFAKAESTYEAVGTAVRADLGDSIRKAFRNVGDLLREAGLEETADNARAVRILGYNRMEITGAAVQEIREQDAKLRDVTERL